MRILITGGSGFIGKNLSRGRKISSKDLDLTDFEATVHYFKEFSPDAIIHCAAKHGNFKDMAEDKVGFFRENQLIGLHVLEAARLAGVKKLIAMSSVTAFPADVDRALTEDDLHLGEPHPSCYSYGHAKRMIDVLCRSYNEQYDVQYTCAILTNIYGPDNNFDLAYATVVSNLIHKCYLAKTAGTDLEVYGDGSPIRDFMFVGDLEPIFLQLLESYSDNSPIVISTGEYVSIKELLDVIVEKMNFQGRIIWGGEKNVGQVKKVSSNKKLRQFLANNQLSTEFTPMESGIEQTVNWFLANADRITGQ